MNKQTKLAHRSDCRSRLCRRLLLLLFPVLLLWVFSSAVHAAGSFREQNLALCDQYTKALNTQLDGYESIDTAHGQPYATAVTSAVNQYLKQLLDLQTHPEVAVRSLESEITLAFLRGSIVGRLTWIYETGAATAANDTESRSFLASYQSLIAQAENDILLDDSAPETYARRLHVAIYTERITSLAEPEDSRTAKAILSGAKDAVANCTWGELSDEPYRAIWEQARTDVALQRHRDALYHDFCDFYKQIEPNGDPESDSACSLLDHWLSQNHTLSAMNQSVGRSAASLLSRYATATHTTAYIGTLTDRVNREVASAETNGRRAAVSLLVTDFSHRYGTALAKDTLETELRANPCYPSATLTALAAEYTADGGILDGCVTESERSFEVWRATLRADWFAHVTAAKQAIVNAMSGFDAAALCAKADSEWSAMDARVRAVSRGQTDAKATCTEAVESGKTAMASLQLDAKAERFRLTHVAMIEAEPSALLSSDRPALVFAIQDWELLSSDVKSRLADPAAKLRENYRTVIRLCLLETVRSDQAEPLRKSHADSLCQILSALTQRDPSDLMSAADALLLRGTVGAALLDEYRDVIKQELYANYDEKYKTELSNAAQAGCRSLRDLTVSDDTLAAELNRIAEQSQLALTKADGLARLTLAAEGSTLAEVTGALRVAEAQIRAAVSRESVKEITDRHLLTVRRILLTRHTEEAIPQAEERLRALSYLSDTQRAAFLARVTEKMTAAKTALAAATDLGTLNLAYTTFSIERDGIVEEAQEADLLACKAQLRGQLEQRITLAKEELDGLTEPEESIKQQFRNDLEGLLTEYLAKINRSDSVEAASARLAEAEAQAKETVRSARLYTLRLARSEQLTALKQEFLRSDYYSANALTRIEQRLLVLTAEWETRDTAEEDAILLKNTKEDLQAIPTLLDDAKTDGAARLQAEYERLMQEAHTYSAAAREQMTATVSEALRALAAIQQVPEYLTAQRITEEALLAMGGVMRDRVTVGATNLSATQYPADHDVAQTGYWGSVTLPNGIGSDRTLTVFPLAQNSDIFYNQCQVALRQKAFRLGDGSPLSASMKRQLKRAELLLALDIETNLPTSATPYLVSVLLPSGLEREDILGVIWFDTDGSAEYTGATVTGSVLTFETNHFSSFYVVTKAPVNLLPWILLVSFLILGEVLAVAYLLARRAKRLRGEDSADGTDGEDTPEPLLPFSGLAALPLPSLLGVMRKIHPEGGGALLALLSGTAILLGAAIIWLAKEEGLLSKESKKKKEKNAHATPKKQIPALASAQRAALPPRREEPVITKDSTEMISNTEALRQSAAGSIATVEEEVENGDFLAANLEGHTHSRDDEKPAAEAPSDAYDHGSVLDEAEDEHRFEINLDVLARHFSAGDCITPELLRKKGLIPANTTHLKILARGRLTIPLFISAHEFSAAALRAIRKAGGKSYPIQ